MSPRGKPTSVKPKRKRVVLSLQDKLGLIRLSEEGCSNAEISRKRAISHQTVSDIIKNKDKILDEILNATPVGTKLIRKTHSLISEMEKVLTIWIKDQTKHNVLLSQGRIQAKALSLFNTIKKSKGKASEGDKFKASSGWFERFKKRCNLHNIKITGDVAKSSSRTFIAKEKAVPDFNAEKNKLSLLLRSNAAGDLSLQTKHNVPLSQELIQAKALSLSNTNKESKRCNLHNSKITGEVASVDIEAAQSYPSELAKIIENGGYNKHQIFSVDETALYWKKMPSRTFIAKEEKAMSGFKAAKDKLTLLLGSNAAGDFRLKPMLIYHTENPSALKNYAKGSLPVYYKSNKKAQMTGDLFTNWFTDCFKPEVEKYCREKKIPFNILLLSDNAPDHPKFLGDMYKEIKVNFLPPNTRSLLQPMDQGVISVFKSLYLRRTFKKAITALDADDSDAPKKNKLQTFWKGYNILDAIKNIRDSWAEIKETTLKGVWKKLVPTLMDDFERFKLPLQQILDNVVEMARELELEVDNDDLTELLVSHDEPLSEEDLFLIDEQRRLFLESEANPEDSHFESKEMMTKDIEQAIKHIEEGLSMFEKIDPNFERSSEVYYIVQNSITCYKEIVRKKKSGEVTVNATEFDSFMKTAELLGVNALCDVNKSDYTEFSSNELSAGIDSTIPSPVSRKRTSQRTSSQLSKLRKFDSTTLIDNNCSPDASESATKSNLEHDNNNIQESDDDELRETNNFKSDRLVDQNFQKINEMNSLPECDAVVKVEEKDI